jgi:uncharacterized membrane protein
MPQGSIWEDRPSLTVWVYDSVLGAAAGQVRLDALVRRGSVEALEAVMVTWVPGAHRPRITGLRLATGGTDGEHVLGRLVHVLTGPGDVLPALAERLDSTGIDAQLLSEIRTALAPGRSSLLVRAASADLDTVRAVIERGRARGDVTLFHAFLTPEAPALLEDALRPAPDS